MELRHIRYFLSVASCQSFTRAAGTVHASQPSLSVQIVALEEELGTRLFDRLGRKVVLTQAGELFRPHAERALRELEHAPETAGSRPEDHQSVRSNSAACRRVGLSDQAPPKPCCERVGHPLREHHA